MQFVFENRLSDSPWVESIWRTQSNEETSFTASASTHVEMVITKQQNSIQITLLGPETQAAVAPIPENAEFLGITFKHGAFLPYFPTTNMVNKGVHLPAAATRSFWLNSLVWDFPTFENADTFVNRLVKHGLLAYDPVISATIQGDYSEKSARSIQRRFLRVTGITQGALVQIERARFAADLLRQGVSILDVVEQAGYYDQPHLTRSLKHLIGQTPAQIEEIFVYTNK